MRLLFIVYRRVRGPKIGTQSILYTLHYVIQYHSLFYLLTFLQKAVPRRDDHQVVDLDAVIDSKKVNRRTEALF